MPCWAFAQFETTKNEKSFSFFFKSINGIGMEIKLWKGVDIFAIQYYKYYGVELLLYLVFPSHIFRMKKVKIKVYIFFSLDKHSLGLIFDFVSFSCLGFPGILFK